MIYKDFFDFLSVFHDKKGVSVKDCAECHKNSISFLKFDIHRFFNSIEKSKLIKKVIKEFDLDAIYEEQIAMILDTCFVEGKLPIGLITSPVLSDIYMRNFDEEFASELGSSYIYTRYADDILISCCEIIDQEEETRIKDLLEKKIKGLGFSLNKEKYRRRNLIKKGEHIKYLGLNIIKSDNENIISVGKTYKNYIAKCFLKYIEMNGENEEKYYFGKQIAGRLSFVKMIEGEAGLRKVYTRIEKSTGGRIVIKDKINNL